MTDKQMPERIWADPEDETYIDGDQYEPDDFLKSQCTEYVRIDLCEKTISDQSASHITLETLVEDIRKEVKHLRLQLDYAGEHCIYGQGTRGREYHEKAEHHCNKILSKLDAWRNK